MKTGLREEESAIEEIRAAERARETQGKIYVLTALIEYLAVLLKYINLLGPIRARGKTPQLLPPLAALIEIEERNLFI